MALEQMTFRIGDKVIKDSGDYTFEGVVVSAFYKLGGQPRFVVEDDRGILHIYSAGNLKFNTKVKG